MKLTQKQIDCYFTLFSDVKPENVSKAHFDYYIGDFGNQNIDVIVWTDMNGNTKEETPTITELKILKYIETI